MNALHSALQSLKEKHKAFIGNRTDKITSANADGFKEGLAWAIDTIETAIEQEQFEEQYNKEQEELISFQNRYKCDESDNHWTKKKKFSNDARNKMSNTKKEMYKDGYVSPVTKRIKQLNLDGSFIREWESATQVQKELGFNRKVIVQCLIKKSKKSNNFLWLYV